MLCIFQLCSHAEKQVTGSGKIAVEQVNKKKEMTCYIKHEITYTEAKSEASLTCNGCEACFKKDTKFSFGLPQTVSANSTNTTLCCSRVAPEKVYDVTNLLLFLERFCSSGRVNY